MRWTPPARIVSGCDVSRLFQSLWAEWRISRWPTPPSTRWGSAGTRPRATSDSTRSSTSPPPEERRAWWAFTDLIIPSKKAGQVFINVSSCWFLNYFCYKCQTCYDERWIESNLTKFSWVQTFLGSIRVHRSLIASSFHDTKNTIIILTGSTN